MICVIAAHPYPHRSRANRVLCEGLSALPDVDLRSLYDLYPDFDIDVATEQQALERADLVVWMHPVFWYSVPALMKHWFDKVLAFGFAYGEGASALHGKQCLWVPTAGGNPHDFADDGLHAHTFATFAPAIEQTALFCGMHWQPPYVVYNANAMDDAQLGEHAAALVARISSWSAAQQTTKAGATP